MDEFALIRFLLNKRGPAPAEVEVDAGDDAAVMKSEAGMSTIFACDTMVETVHFLPETMQPEDIGWKCMAANISDVAAMGGKPNYALVSLAVPETWKPEALKQLYTGMHEICRRFGTRVVGGDTVRSPQHLVVTISLMGSVESGRSLLRSTARPGDVLFVTGELGGSAAGLHLMLREDRHLWMERYPGLVKAHRRPLPDVKAGRWLLQTGCTVSCDDVSDGLAHEAWEIAEASGVRLVLDGARLPLAEEVRSYAREIGQDPLEWALSGGEDFHLVGTLPQADWPRLHREAGRVGIRLFAVGRVEEGVPGVDCIVDGHRRERVQKGYNHFSNR
ncbi:thiamine-monophosphate kinase [Melghirimyces thermohalophilus]|uniref:Thiamine-monophosphate kinase n=1 Tax=Melghirimyces thermohalophilus TaxID=1236220 RepID=A0A1G6R6I0_9BACL|nr:thiamine-phosphate kinase [Melghirimyces thermohalophilus]SDD00229.1 thiamine-monophosphate kinase [Melghirimyces thermohalophilus]